MAKQPNKQVGAYKSAHQLSSPNEGERLLKCYDQLRKASASHDRSTVVEILRVLESSLQPKENPMLAFTLVQLYQLIRTAVESDKYADACRIADELHAMWQQGIAAHQNRIDAEKNENV